MRIGWLILSGPDTLIIFRQYIVAAVCVSRPGTIIYPPVLILRSVSLNNALEIVKELVKLACFVETLFD